MATSLPANGWFSADEWNIGIAGGFASETTRALMGESDCIIAVGASLNHFTSRGGSLYSPDATIIQVDEHAEAFGKYTRRDIDALGDARLVTELLTAGSSPAPRLRTPDTADRIAVGDVPETDASDARGLDPRIVASELPAGTVLAVDGGHFMASRRRTAGLCLHARLRLGLPLLIVVFNDASYRAELHFLRMCDLPEDACRYDTTAPIEPVARRSASRRCGSRPGTTLRPCVNDSPPGRTARFCRTVG